MANISGIFSSIRQIMWQDTGLNGDAQRIEQLAWMLFLKIFSDKDEELELLNDNYTSPIPNELRWRKEKGNWAGDDEGMTGEVLLEFVDRTLFPTLRDLSVTSSNKRALILREAFMGNNNYMKSGTNFRKVLNKLNEIDFNASEDRHVFGDIYEGFLKELQAAGKSGEFYTPRAVTQFMTEMVAPKLGEKILDPACGTGGFLTCALEYVNEREVKTADDRTLLHQSIKGNEYKPLPYLLGITNLILHDVEVPNITYGDALNRPLTEYSERDRVDVILANPPFGGIVANDNEQNFPAFRTKESADLFLVLMIHLLKNKGRAAIVLPDGSLTGEGVKQRVRQKLLEDCHLHTIVRLPNSVFQPYATVATNLLFFTKGNGPGSSPSGKLDGAVWYYEHRLPEGQKAYSKTRPIRVEEFAPLREWWNNRVETEQAWRVPMQTIIDRNYDLDIKNPNKVEEKMTYSSTELLELLAASMQKSKGLLEGLK